MKAEELTIQITAEMDDDVKALVAGYKSQIEELKHQKQILENEKDGFCDAINSLERRNKMLAEINQDLGDKNRELRGLLEDTSEYETFTVKAPKNDVCDFLKLKDAVLKHFIKDRTIRFSSPSYDFDKDRIEIKVELIPVEED